MTRKAAAKGRKGRQAGTGGRTARQSAARATSRTGKKTSSDRGSHATTAVAQRGRPNHKAAAPPEREVKLEEGRLDQTHGTYTEEDEDLDWLKEDEDPRSQIVEDDDEWEPQDREKESW